VLLQRMQPPPLLLRSLQPLLQGLLLGPACHSATQKQYQVELQMLVLVLHLR
jgi:hypothetical protein